MNTEELRIGNWVQDTYENKLMVGVGNFNPYRDMYAIPLTPEILEKCGFTTDEMKVEYRIGLPIGHGSDLFIEDEGHPSMSCGVKTDDRHFNYFKDIRYLHQLQNLYFALTQTELTINLPSWITSQK